MYMYTLPTEKVDFPLLLGSIHNKKKILRFPCGIFVDVTENSMVPFFPFLAAPLVTDFFQKHANKLANHKPLTPVI